jgi:hypothetical protein
MARRTKSYGVRLGQFSSNRFLALADKIDGTSVLRANIVTLAKSLCRIVTFVEAVDDVCITHDLGVENYLHDFGVTRHTGAHLFIGRVRREAALVTDARREHAGELEELAFRPPKTAHGHVRCLAA